jgi:opine dehydrogenase
MRVAIIGSGGIGRGYFAYLSSQGHHPILWSPSGAAQTDFPGTARLDVTGQLETSLPPVIARDCAEAVEDAEAIIIAVSANGFRAVLDQLTPHLANGQTVIIS